MASTTKSLRSSTANKRPTTAIADGQIALNTNATSPGLYFKDSTGAAIIKIGPVHVGTTAPNVSPGAGGSAGNSTGETWLDTSLTPNGWKVWTGAAWVNATPSGSTTVQGLLELATNAETQTGSDNSRAVTPAGLQSKVSNSTSTTSSTTIASSTAVKAAYDLADAALPKAGGTVTGNLEIGSTGSLTFEGATADAFETTLAVVDPTADRTITLPNATGTVVLDNNAQTVQFGLGAVGTPSITFSGDTNTGIYSPGADTLAFAEGGVEAMRIDSSGRVGIGTSSPSERLDLGGGVSDTIKIRFSMGGNVGTIGSVGSGVANGLGNLTFFTRNGSSEVAAMTIDGSQRVGIGTTSPAGLVHGRAAAGAVGLLLDGNTGDSNTSPPVIDFRGSAGTGQGARIAAINTGLGFGRLDLAFYTSNTGSDTYTPAERARIDSSGNVGIGTSAPQAKLEVNAGNIQVWNSVTASLNTLLNYGLTFRSTNQLGQDRNVTAEIKPYLGDASNNDFGLQFRTQATSASGVTTKMTLTPGGAVGIGTTSPGNQNTTQVTSDNDGIRVQLQATPIGGEGPRLIFGHSTNNGTQQIFAAIKSLMVGGNDVTWNSDLAFYTGGSSLSERARIDSSGRLLVGTSTARSLFFTGGASALTQIEGNSTATASLSITRNDATADGNALILAKARSAAYAIVQYVNGTVSDDRIGRISFQGADGTNMVPAASIEAYVDGTPGADDMPGRLVFSTTADGSATPTERMRIDNQGRVLFQTPTADATTNGYQFIDLNPSNTGSRVLSKWRTGTFNSSDTSSVFMLLERGDGTAVGSIARNGTSAVAYNTSSDYRLKENVKNVISPVDRFMQLKPCNFNFIGEDRSVDGFIAHEAQEVVPECVTGEKDAVDANGNPVYQGIDQSKLVPLLTAALQEAIGKIEILEARLTAAGIA